MEQRVWWLIRILLTCNAEVRYGTIAILTFVQRVEGPQSVAMDSHDRRWTVDVHTVLCGVMEHHCYMGHSEASSHIHRNRVWYGTNNNGMVRTNGMVAPASTF